MQDDQRYILNTYQRMPVEIVKGEGSYLYDRDGKRYLDMFAGIAVNALGHHHPNIIKALHEQSNQYLHLSNYFESKPVISLAKNLVDHSFADKVFFTNSGTEAIEASIKLARKWGRQIHPEKTDFISLVQGFHGRSSGGMALTGKPSYEAMFGPLLPGIKHVPFNDLEALIESINERTCAIYLEMIQGEGGIHVLDETIIKTLVQLSNTYNVLIIVDEIQTGIMRTGKLFAYEHFDLIPDMVTIAKAIGGGLPLGALLVNEKLAKVLTYGDHGSTFGGNPLACALGDALFTTVIEPSFQTLVISNGTYLKDELLKLKVLYPKIIKEVRGFGMMLGVDVSTYAPWFKSQCLNHGILINVTAEHVIRLLPPLNIDKKALEAFIKTFHMLLEQIKESSYAV